MIINQENLESLIKRFINLGTPSSKGFCSVKCSACQDYKTRGGFKFELGTTWYHCFNCGIKAKHVDRERLSKNMRQILVSFGVPEDELEHVVNSAFFQPGKDQKPVEIKRNMQFPLNEVALPPSSHSITADTSPWCEVARVYLKGRSLDETGSQFYVSDHFTDKTDWRGRIIIPYMFRNKIVYWQARSMDDSITPRYKNPVVDKENIFFNMDEIYRYTNDPLFVTEGPLDALSIGNHAIATLGSSLSSFKERELKRVGTKRKVVFIIDKNKVGAKLGRWALKHDDLQFYITCFPDNVEDSNHALQRFGKLWLINHISSTAVKGFEGNLLLNLRCN